VGIASHFLEITILLYNSPTGFSRLKTSAEKIGILSKMGGKGESLTQKIQIFHKFKLRAPLNNPEEQAYCQLLKLVDDKEEEGEEEASQNAGSSIGGVLQLHKTFRQSDALC